MGAPYETPPFKVTVGGGESGAVQVRFPTRSFIHKIVVIQTLGTTESFNVELFSHADALGGTEASASSSDDDGNKIPLDCYRVGSTKTGENGSLMYFSDEATGGAGLPFVCHDVDPGRQGQKLQNLYVRITPAGTGAKEFMVCIGGDAAIGS